MFRRFMPTLGALLLGVGLWSGCPTDARAQFSQTSSGPTLNRFFYYPYYYFPHSYWPTQSPKWPEPVGAPYTPAPAYMAYPPFKEPHWRYEFYEPQRFYRGFHFTLDQF